ncbi:MAG TPA: T9SS type A sorting domain-containing protein [Candidatus Edwardsbacteria bacterium]|nr:T9SS type A sorting domain-containing protein [Candidatus Edwardsbacteria bacterium]
MIRYQLPTASVVKVELYNITGQRIATLFDGQQNSGFHATSWDLRDANGSAVPNGVYFIRLSAGSRQVTSKLIVIR